MSASGRRYRGLSAEERRADQRERLVRAAINEFSERGYHRTSVEDIVRSARTSRTAFYAFFDNREDAMYGALQASLRGLLDAVRARSAHARPDESLIEVGVTAFVELPRRPIPAAARIILLEGVGTSPEVNALRSRVRREVAERRPRDLGTSTTPRPRRRRRRRRSRSACSASCSSRCCTSSRRTASTRRRRTFPRSSPRSSGCSRPPTEPPDIAAAC